MRSSTILAAIAAAGSAMAQRPADMPICDYYTTALLKNNTAANQYTLLTLLVNTAVIGNYTKPNVGIAVTGILNKGTYKGEEVNLLPYFTGELDSTNFNGKAIAVNFLDGGGAAPLMLNMPANNSSSIQYGLITHLYQFFGALLGCSEYGAMGFPSYKGKTSMGDVHRFMDLDASEVGYFIMQVGLSAASFGVTDDDVTAVGTALTKLFDYKCAPPVAILPNSTAELQSICQAEDCPLAPNATCAAYPLMGMPTSPANASVTMMPTGTMMPSATSSTASMFTGAAQAIGAGVGSVAAAGLFALALAL
ncbi:hypothetical protein BU16DRAFT_332828 [Lophium mytilinum]|uniref:Uncharacterized protein n=1 Tax=Lophium mytilinum TaxID=390894 RepID=A0A6A6R289_9PEZI|nr:hypothetical protein BU16DRAFT_332828 [Lophium mytilinum]